MSYFYSAMYIWFSNPQHGVINICKIFRDSGYKFKHMQLVSAIQLGNEKPSCIDPFVSATLAVHIDEYKSLEDAEKRDRDYFPGKHIEIGDRLFSICFNVFDPSFRKGVEDVKLCLVEYIAEQVKDADFSQFD